MNDEPEGDDDYPSNLYAWYIVAVLTLAYIVSFIDRQILSLLVKPIKADLGITDTKMSLLMGLTFAIFYTLFGIPLGRLADTRSRRTIIAVGVTLWSLMTAGCGLTKNFWQLALMRIGVGVGEASLSPSAYSLLADCFRPRQRSTAMSVYTMGIFVGSGLASILGSAVIGFTKKYSHIELPWIGPIHTWQLVFLIVGLPGLAVALLLLTIREPTRKGLGRASTAQPVAPLSEVWTYIRDNAWTFACLNLGVALITLHLYGVLSWTPEMFMRRYSWTPEETGLVFGIVVMVSGTLGLMTGGRMADRHSARGRSDAPMLATAISTLGCLPFGIAYPLGPSAGWATVLLAPTFFFLSIPFGAAPAAIQRAMPNGMRAQATAVYLFVINIIGMGLGPTAVALLTDDVFREQFNVHYSLAIVGAAAQSAAAIFLFAGLKSYRGSLEYLEEWTATVTAANAVGHAVSDSAAN